jgi:hypothetical protein
LFEILVQWLAEAARPHLHCTTSSDTYNSF